MHSLKSSTRSWKNSCATTEGPPTGLSASLLWSTLRTRFDPDLSPPLAVQPCRCARIHCPSSRDCRPPGLGQAHEADLVVADKDAASVGGAGNAAARFQTLVTARSPPSSLADLAKTEFALPLSCPVCFPSEGKASAKVQDWWQIDEGHV